MNGVSVFKRVVSRLEGLMGVTSGFYGTGRRES